MKLLKNYLHSPAAVIGLFLLGLVILMALIANILYPDNPLNLAARPLLPPFSNLKFWLGTDPSGRDIAAQIFHGAKTSLWIGTVAMLLAMILGILIGAFAGFYGGIADKLLMRVTEAFQTIPGFLLLLIVVAVFGSNLNVVVPAIGLVTWPPIARLVRAEFLSLRNREFIQSNYVIGLSNRKIIFTEILPNALPPVIVYASVVMALAILMESALAFLNLSDPNIASWGNLIGVGRTVLRTQWYVSAIPGIAILITVLAISLVGQGLNDAWNPRLKAK